MSTCTGLQQKGKVLCISGELNKQGRDYRGLDKEINYGITKNRIESNSTRP
jgi:hypothetical protein